MNRLIDPDISIELLSNEQLLHEYHLDPNGIGKSNYYAILARRASTSKAILDLLLNIVASEEARNEQAMGFIMKAWLPVIFLLKEGDDDVISQLCEKLKHWTFDELEDLKSYLKSDLDISEHLGCLDA